MAVLDLSNPVHAMMLCQQVLLTVLLLSPLLPVPVWPVCHCRPLSAHLLMCGSRCRHGMARTKIKLQGYVSTGLTTVRQAEQQRRWQRSRLMAVQLLHTPCCMHCMVMVVRVTCYEVVCE